MKMTLLALAIASSMAVLSRDAMSAPHVAGTPLGDRRCQLQLTSADRTQIIVDYALYEVQSRGGTAIYADAIRLYASGSSLSPSSRVRFVLVSRDSEYGQEVGQADATYEYGEYGLNARPDFALLVQFKYARMDASRRRPAVEVAVVADGAWLKDPISESSNFRIDLTESPDCVDLFGEGKVAPGETL